MRTIGIDLAIKAEHRAIVMDERGEFITPVLKFATTAAGLDQLLTQARAGAPRSWVWIPVGSRVGDVRGGSPRPT